MFAPWRSQNPVRKTWVSDYWKIIHFKLIVTHMGGVGVGAYGIEFDWEEEG